VGVARIEKPENLKISHFDPMHPHGSISTSAMHFIISKMVSAVRADAARGRYFALGYALHSYF